MAKDKIEELKKPEKEPCQRFACAIQTCLKSNNYDEAKCQKAIEDMKKCCDKLTTYSYICQGKNSHSKKVSFYNFENYVFLNLYLMKKIIQFHEFFHNFLN